MARDSQKAHRTQGQVGFIFQTLSLTRAIVSTNLRGETVNSFCHLEGFPPILNSGATKAHVFEANRVRAILFRFCFSFLFCPGFLFLHCVLFFCEFSWPLGGFWRFGFTSAPQHQKHLVCNRALSPLVSLFVFQWGAFPKIHVSDPKPTLNQP